MRALVSVLKRESKFELRSPYDPTLLSFLKSLPNARWNKAGKFWACDATPAAAAKICRETPAEVQAENAVRELAASFVEGVSAPLPPNSRRFARPTCGDTKSPGITSQCSVTRRCWLTKWAVGSRSRLLQS